MDEKKIVETIKQNSPIRVRDLQKKLLEKGFYINDYKIAKILEKLEKTKKIKRKSLRGKKTLSTLKDSIIFWITPTKPWRNTANYEFSFLSTQSKTYPGCRKGLK